MASADSLELGVAPFPCIADVAIHGIPRVLRNVLVRNETDGRGRLTTPNLVGTDMAGLQTLSRSFDRDALVQAWAGGGF